jgi:hypothetical protein
VCVSVCVCDWASKSSERVKSSFIQARLANPNESGELGLALNELGSWVPIEGIEYVSLTN